MSAQALAALALDSGLEQRQSQAVGRAGTVYSGSSYGRRTRLPDLHAVLANHFSVV